MGFKCAVIIIIIITTLIWKCYKTANNDNERAMMYIEIKMLSILCLGQVNYYADSTQLKSLILSQSD